MFIPLTSGSPMLRRRVPPAYGPSYGLLDALDRPQLVPIADVSQVSKPTEVPQGLGISPLRWLTRQAGLLDVLGGSTDAPQPYGAASTRNSMSPDRGPVTSTPFVSPRYSHFRADREADEGDGKSGGFGKWLLQNAVDQPAKDLWTGYLIGASGMYDTAGDAFGLLNRANDFMTQWTGVGQMSEGTIWKDAEDWLHNTAIEVAPRSEDLPTSIPGKIYAGIGQAPAELAQLLTAARLVGPVAGLAGLEGVRASEHGWAAAGEAAAKGALFGLAAKALDPLNWIARSAGLASLGAASSVAEGGNSSDAIASAASLGLLGAFGVPRAKQPNLVPLHVAYSDFNEAAKHTANSLDIIRGLSPKRQQQLRIQISKTPGLRLEDVVRRSDDLLGYTVGRGGRYKLPPDPELRDTRIFDASRSKWWWRKPQEVEVKRENAKPPRAQRLADERLEEQGVSIDRRRENEVLRRARIQLGMEGRFDVEARRLAEAVRRRARRRGQAD